MDTLWDNRIDFEIGRYSTHLIPAHPQYLYAKSIVASLDLPVFSVERAITVCMVVRELESLI
jgi:hypothetical protein